MSPRTTTLCVIIAAILYWYGERMADDALYRCLPRPETHYAYSTNITLAAWRFPYKEPSVWTVRYHRVRAIVGLEPLDPLLSAPPLILKRHTP